jgi:hypothetical protein
MYFNLPCRWQRNSPKIPIGIPLRKAAGFAYSRTATGMDGTLHTDFRKSETSRDIKKSF